MNLPWIENGLSTTHFGFYIFWRLLESTSAAPVRVVPFPLDFRWTF